MSFTGVQQSPTEWVYTLTYDPFDNFAVCPAPDNVATITLSGLSGVVAATAPTSHDLVPAFPGDLLWTPQVSSDGSTVTWTHVGPGTGNFTTAKHVYGFTITTASTVPNGVVTVASKGFSVDVSRTGPCPPQGGAVRDFTGATYGPVSVPSSPPTPAAAVRPRLGVLQLVPGPRAGTRVTASFRATRSDDGAPLRAGTMTCDPRIAGMPIPYTEQFRNGTGRLAFTIPKQARGKLLTVKVTITLDTRSTTRTSTFRVR